MDDDAGEHGSDPTPPQHKPGMSPQARQGLRTALWIVGITVVVTGFVVVGLGILFAIGISQWAANK